MYRTTLGTAPVGRVFAKGRTSTIFSTRAGSSRSTALTAGCLSVCAVMIGLTSKWFAAPGTTRSTIKTRLCKIRYPTTKRWFKRSDNTSPGSAAAERSDMNSPCSHCEVRVDLTVANTVIHAYVYQPWFAWAEIICSCNQTSSQFLGADWRELLGEFLEAKHGFIYEDFADDNLITQFEAIFDRQLIREVQLTPRLHQLAEQWSLILQSTSDDDVLWELSQPAPHLSLPQGWC